MARRRISVDWKMVLGFLGLLLLIIAIGLVGIRQIQDLSRVIDGLAKREIPLQNAVLQMKSSNGKYAMGIRSYMFWRSARYLEAASVVEKLDLVNSALQNFDKHLARYSSLIKTQKQRDWAKALKESQAELRKAGNAIISLVDKKEESSDKQKSELDYSINRQLMAFESKLFQIDAYLDDPIQKFNLDEIDGQLAIAEIGRRRSIFILELSLAIGLFLGLQTALLIYRRSKQEQEQRELLCRRVIKLEEEERNNLSLQIHDQMGQDLSALKIYLGIIDKDISGEAKEAKEKIQKAKSILDGLMEKTHNVSELLRPPELDDLGLVESISALVMRYQDMTGYRFTYERPQGDLKLSREYSLVLYRVVQEALTNIAKHSRAKNVGINVQAKGDSVFLAISDDGKGFTYNKYLKRPKRRKEDKVKLGLQGLRERMEVLGGKLSIHTKPGQGTRLEVLMPMI